MKKNENSKDDKEQVVEFDGPGIVVNFFSALLDEEEAKINNSDTADHYSSEWKS